MSLVKQAISGFKWNGFATFLNVAINSITLIIMSRILSPRDFGLMGMIAVVTGFINTFRDFGFTDAVVYSQNATRDQLSSVYWFNMILGWSCFIVVWLITPFVVAFYKEPELVSLLRWSGVYFLIVPISQQFNGLLKKELRFKTKSLVLIFGVVINNGSKLILAFLGMGVMSLVWSNLIGGLLSSLVLIFIAARLNWLPNLCLKPSELKGFIKFGSFYTLQNAIGYISKNIDYLLIGRFLGADDLGYYTLAYNLVRIPANYLSPLINSVAFPAFARLQNQVDLIRKGYFEIIRYLSSALVPMSVGLFVVAPIFVPVFYGEKWIPAVPVVQIFCAMGFVMSLIDSTDNILMAKGRTDLGFGLSILAVLGYGSFNLIGLKWGIIGVAISSTLFATFILWPADFFIRKYLTKMRLSEFWKVINLRLVAGVSMGIIITMVAILFSGLPNILLLVFQVVVGVITYITMLWLLDRPFFIDVGQKFLSRTPHL